jgi:hypothetical protein
MRKLTIAILLLLASGVADAQIKYSEYLVTYKGFWFGRTNRCYLVRFDLDVSLWEGVCDVMTTAPGKGPYLDHREIVYWNSRAREQSSKRCDADCPAKPAPSNLTIFTDSAGSPIYQVHVLDTAPDGVIGASDPSGQPELLFTHPQKRDLDELVKFEQKKCLQAAQWLGEHPQEQDWLGPSRDNAARVSFTGHLNITPRNNDPVRCLVLVSVSPERKFLADVGDHKLVGELKVSPGPQGAATVCYVGVQRCEDDPSRWSELVKPYMED